MLSFNGERGATWLDRSRRQFLKAGFLGLGGLSLADVVIPKTRPEQAGQLTLFGES